VALEKFSATFLFRRCPGFAKATPGGLRFRLCRFLCLGRRQGYGRRRALRAFARALLKLRRAAFALNCVASFVGSAGRSSTGAKAGRPSL